MGKQAVEDLLSSRDDSTGNHHIDATQAPVSSSLKVNLMEHQKAGYNWMCQKEDSDLKGGLLADDMGLGKVTGKGNMRHFTHSLSPFFRPYNHWRLSLVVLVPMLLHLLLNPILTPNHPKSNPRRL
jgi:hypothetical protein